MITCGMESRDYIIKAFEHLLPQKPGRTQKDVADFLGVQPPQLNGFLKKTRNFSEKKREMLAEFFDMTYIEMLFLGRDLTNGKPIADNSTLKMESSDMKLKFEMSQKLVKSLESENALLKEKISRLEKGAAKKSVSGEAGGCPQCGTG